MSTQHQFMKNKLAVGVSIALAASTMGLQAQTSKQSVIELEEEVVVTGIRGSLQRAQAVKMNSSSVVEGLSAEDIGKLPDSSIAESLARLPGLAGERRNGRTSGISVRGFREDFVGATLNNRELIGIGDNRGVDYDLYPSEIINGATIHKSSDASLAISGIGGTVDLQTIKPLDVDSYLKVSGSYEANAEQVNPDYDDTGHRLSLSYGDSYLDGTLGLAVTLATTSSPTQAEHNAVIEGWVSSQVTSGEFAGVRVPNGIDTAARSRILERDTLAAVLQFEPNDRISASLDLLYIDFSEEGISRGFIEFLPNEANGSNISGQDAGGFATGGTSTGFHSVIRSDPLNKNGELTSYGANLAFQINDNWDLTFDIAHSESDKVEQRAESYAGNGRAGLSSQGDSTIRSWQATDQGLIFDDSNGANNIDFASYDVVRLAGPQAWGGSMASIPEYQESQSSIPGIGFVQAQDGFDNTKVFEEELDTFRIETSGEFEHSFFKSLNVGFNYTEHTKSKDNQGFFLTAPSWPGDGSIPEEFRRGTTDLSWAGLGEVVAYDAQSVIQSGFYDRNDAQQLEPDRVGDIYEVSEEYWTQFTKLSFETGDDIRFFGNVGYQAISTDQSVTNFNGVTGPDARVVSTEITTDHDYFRFLPSLNLNLDFNNGHIGRVSLAKVITRARIDDIGQGSSIRHDNAVSRVRGTTAETGPWTSTSGNATLDPYEAKQLDASYEWYFSDLGYLSVAYFYKDLVNWTRSSTEVRDYSDSYIPGFHQGVDNDGNVFTPGTFLGVNTFVESGLTGSVDGFEYQLNLPFGEFSDALDGFGMVVSAAFSEGSLDDGGRIPGHSEEVKQITFYYENSGFEFRIAGTDRSSFLSEQAGGSNSLQPTNRTATRLVDAQLSYDFAESGIEALEGLTVSLQGQNLTDEDDTTIDADGAFNTNERYGSNYLLTFNYSIF